MALQIKGIKDGLLLALPQGDWDSIISELENEINSKKGFLHGAAMYIDASSRELKAAELEKLANVLTKYEIDLRGLAKATKTTNAEAEKLGMKTGQIVERHTRSEANGINLNDIYNIKPAEIGKVVPEKRKNDPVDKFPANACLINKSIRSGMSVQKKENIIILGDVNPGGEVSSAGNVIILGKIKGKIIAGMNGDDKAYIYAYSAENAHLEICGKSLFIAKKKNEQKSGAPVVYKLKESEITAEYCKI